MSDSTSNGLPDWNKYEASMTHDSHEWGDLLSDPRTIERCLQCSKPSKIDVVASNLIGGSQIQRMSGTPPSSAFTQLQTWKCRVCEEFLIEVVEFEEAIGTSTGDLYRSPTVDRFVWPTPSPRSAPEFTPDEVGSFYAEASVAEAAGALRAAGVLYRATAEAIVKEKGCSGKDLYAQINDLSRFDVPDDLIDDLHEARILGNDSIHDGIRFSIAEVDDVAALLHEAMEDIYTIPGRHASNRESREARRVSQKSVETPRKLN